MLGFDLKLENSLIQSKLRIQRHIIAGVGSSAILSPNLEELRERSLFMRGEMGENLKISIFFQPPPPNKISIFFRPPPSSDKMHHIC